MPKTKCEAIKDAITGINGMSEAGRSLYQLCTKHLGEDFGMYQINALLDIAKRDLEFQLTLPENLT